MKNLPLLIVTVIGTLALVFALAYMFTQPSRQTVDASVVAGDKRLAKGSAEAKVVVVEFSDFQCPACRASASLGQRLVETYGDQVQFVFRHFPLTTIHPNAQMAAQAAEAAAAEGKFWEMHDLLFAKQDEWAGLNEAALLTQFESYTSQLQIDKNNFMMRIQSEAVKQNVAKDIADGMNIKVNATPTFYVNGKQTSAPQVMPTVESLLKAQSGN